MKFIRNVKAISKLLLILLLLMATITGAILSYLWVMGYFITLESVIPEKTTVSIANVTFNPQNTSYFFVTLLNPSYSPTEASVTEIVASTGKDIHNITEVHPLLPYSLLRSEEETFKCVWNWANYTGENVKIIAFVADGSGPTFETETPLVDLKITDVRFNSTISVTQFNMTVQNSASSVTQVNITEITVATETLKSEDIAPSLPIRLDPDSSVTLKCSWDWANHQNISVKVAVHTLQGYMNHTAKLTPLPVTLEVTKVDFDFTNTTLFDVTVRNNEVSPTYLSITRITVTIENQIVREWIVENGTEVDPHIPYTLNKNSSETFVCPWNWTEHRDKNVTVTIYTLQGFTAQYIRVTPASLILEIVNPIFNPLEANSFNVTVKNSEFSIMDTNVTEITVTVDGISENITNVVPSLQGGITLLPGTNRTFTCSWNWTEYSGKNVTIVVKTHEGYSAYSTPVPLAALTISDVHFNLLDTTHFIVAVQNPTELSFNLTTINAEIKDGSVLNITDVEPDLPFLLPPSTNITFMCSCEDWTGYQGKDVTIAVETSEGYTTSRMCKIPSA
jgi:hypothetical protein